VVRVGLVLRYRSIGPGSFGREEGQAVEDGPPLATAWAPRRGPGCSPSPAAPQVDDERSLLPYGLA